MQNDKRIKEILGKIRNVQDGFCISEDKELTKSMGILLNKIDWDDLWITNSSKTREAGRDGLRRLDYELDMLYAKKDINNLLPEKTRFRLFKKIIRRVMYTVTRDQEEFNREVFRTLNEVKRLNTELYAKILMLQIDVEAREKEIVSLEKKLHENAIEEVE